jgi:hypothetical protein
MKVFLKMMYRFHTAAAVFFALAVFFAAPSVYANTLINNSASAVVKGDIIITGNGNDAGTAVEIGSIIYGMHGAHNVHVSAVVDGSIIVPSGTDLNIGSYHGK